MKNKHSKLPWYVQENVTGFSIKSQTESKTRQDSLVCTLSKGGKLQDEQKSNAEFIVNACNSYHKTLDALRSCIDAITYDTDAEAENCKWQLPFNVVYKIKLAIAEAVGVPQPNYPDFGPGKNVSDDLDSGQIEYFSKTKVEA